MMASSRRTAVQREPEAIIFEWKSRGESGFNRTIHQIAGDTRVQGFKDTLGCEVGNDYYWQHEIVQDATALVPDSKTPITHVMLAMLGVSVVGFAIIRAGKLCAPPEDETSERAVCKANQPSWYIEFICAQKDQGYGGLMMNEIQRAAVERDVQYICLSALPSVIMFYHNLGYKLTLNLECLENPRISELADQIRAEIKRRKDLGLPKLKKLDDMLADQAFGELLVYAVREKLSMVRNRGDDCKDTKSCVEDGVYMVMCLPKKRMQLVASEMTEPQRLRYLFSSMPTPNQMDLEDDEEFMKFMRK